MVTDGMTLEVKGVDGFKYGLIELVNLVIIVDTSLLFDSKNERRRRRKKKLRMGRGCFLHFI